MAEVQSWVDYHEKELKRASEAVSLLKGNLNVMQKMKSFSMMF